MLHLLKTSAYLSTEHYACKNKQVQLQSHATFKFASTNMPRFLTNEALVIIVQSKERQILKIPSHGASVQIQ
jgi:hypothetical protein